MKTNKEKAKSIVRDMQSEDEDFVSMCGHSLDEAKDNPIFIQDCHSFSIHRKKWFREKFSQGFRAKVALLDNTQVGFLYVIPIEICPWGPLGEELLVVPCLNVNTDHKGKGIGAALLKAAEEEIEKQRKKGLVIVTHHWKDDFWFMPSSYFEKQGYITVRRKDHPSGNSTVMLWKTKDPTAKIPAFLERNYTFELIGGKVVIDLFYNTFCETSNTEANRVREVAAEFGEKVLLREFSADDRKQLEKYQISRAIYVNGKEISWGYEAPRDGIREAIKKNLADDVQNKDYRPVII